MAINGTQVFGAGRFFGVNNVSNPTPMRARVPQDMSIDFKLATKDLYGENRLPVAVAAGELSVTGKVTLGSLEARMFADLIFTTGSTTGEILEADKEAGVVPATGPYTVTVANSVHWTTDLGVMYADGSGVFTRVASAPAAGQYTVAAGAYTFAAGDASKNVVISYLYTNATAGETVALTDSLQGPSGSFTAVMAFLNGPAQQNVLTLTNAIPSGASIASKQGDFAKPTFDFMAAADVTDSLGTFSFCQAA